MTPAKRAWLILVLLALPEAVPLALYTVWYGYRFARSLGFTSGHAGTAAGWVSALAFAAIYAGFTVTNSAFIRQRFWHFDLMKLFVLLVFAPVTGAFEELYFRKILMNTVAAHGGGVLIQIVASALLFGVAHGIWGLFGKSMRIAVGATVATSILGAMMAVAYIVAGRSVAPCIVAHALLNAAIEPWLILAAVSGAWRSTDRPPSLAR